MCDQTQFVVDAVRRYEPVFHTMWQKLGFIQEGGTALCVLCGRAFPLRSSCLMRHFTIFHENQFSTQEEKREVISKELSKLNWIRKRNNRFDAQTENAKPVGCDKSLAAECSYALTRYITKKGRPYTDGQYIKEAFTLCADSLFNDLPNKELIKSRLRQIPASPTAIKSICIAEFLSDLRAQKAASSEETTIYSVALTLSDLPADGTCQLALVVRFCHNDSIVEDLCSTTSFDTEPTGCEVLSFVKASFRRKKISYCQVFSFITDYAPVFVDSDYGFLSLFEQELGRGVVKYHCLLDLPRLLGDVSDSNLDFVMDTVGTIIKYVASNSPFLDERFHPFRREIQKTPSSRVAWLGSGQVLNTFVTCLDVVKSFVSSLECQAFPELRDPVWINLLLYVTDILDHLFQFQKSLDSEGKTVLDLFHAWRAFILKMQLFIHDLSSRTYHYFPLLKDFHMRFGFITDDCLQYTQGLLNQFSKRWDDLYAYEEILPFLVDPCSFDLLSMDLALFPMLDVHGFERQFAELKEYQPAELIFRDLRRVLAQEGANRGAHLAACWSAVPDKFVSVKKLASTLLSAFGRVSFKHESTC